MVIEMIGYIGSALVLVSMLMTSVVKLRIINLTGSVIFAAYALMIRSYPTALMNIALAGINIYYLVRIFRQKKIYDPVRTKRDDSYFSFLLDRNIGDINVWFPEFSPEDVRANVAYLICCGLDPACLFLGRSDDNGCIEVMLDYALPVYRDTSVGRFLYDHLAKEGYSSLKFTQNAAGHVPYMEKMGYRKIGDNSYVLDLK